MQEPVQEAAREHAQEPAPHDADRRLVTVLFADLTGFTALAEQLDPETVRAFQNALFETLAQAIARFDGFAEKYVGDAVMAVFGAPRAHEDDPLRALQAACAMLAGVDVLSARWAARLGRAVTLHIGVHTGPVVAGSLGSAAHAAYAVTGDTVNTAARLLAAAEPGTVLASEATRRLTCHRFEFADAQALALRGKAQPLRVHRVIGERGAGASARGLAELGLAAPLVGRVSALDALHRAFERTLQGRAQLVTVSAEAGAGKSRLLDEWFAQLEHDRRLDGVALRRVSCSSLGEPTYGIFARLFREAYEVNPADPLDVARGKLQQGLLALGAQADEALAVGDVLHYVLGIRSEPPRDIEPEQLQRQIALAARALIERRLVHQPVLMVIDDLQWADAASVDLLGDVLDQLAERSLLLVVAQRPGARALRDGRDGRDKRAEATTIALEPLAPGDTLVLVEHLLGTAAGAALGRVRELVAARAGGNPLFVEEIVRSLVARGLLVRDGACWTCAADCGAADVPPTLYGLLLSRVDALAPDERRCLQEAAVLGADFDADLLRRIASEPAQTDAALVRLARAGLIRAHDGGWRFTHALLHEVVYENLLLARRSELHRRAGLALEAPLEGAARGPQRLADLEALGHHWSLSPDKARGARYLLAAGDWARAIYANDDAMRHYERTLRTLAEAEPDVLGAHSPEPHSLEETRAMHAAGLDAHERLGDLLGLEGRHADALAHYAAVLHAIDAAPDPQRAARVLRKTGGLHWEAGRREHAAACFADGLERLGEAGDVVERAHLFQEMGRLAFRAGDSTTALTLAQRALDAVQALPAGDAEGDELGADAVVVRAQACNTLGVALARLGRSADAVEQIERSVALAERHEMLQAACRGYTNLAVLYASLDPQRSIETCLRGLETARKVGDLGFQSRLYANLAVAYCALTNRCEAEGIEAAHAAANLDRRLGLLDHLAVPLIVLGQIHQCHGDHPRAFESYREALQLAERIDEPQLLFPCYDGLATLYLDAGDPVQAELYLGKAQAVCERAGLEPDALMVLPFLC